MPMLAGLYVVELKSVGNSLESERRQIQRLIAASGKQLRDASADRRRMHDAVPAEAASHHEVLNLGMSADDSVLIKVLIS